MTQQKFEGWWFSETHKLCNSFFRIRFFSFFLTMFVQRRTVQLQLFRVQWSQKRDEEEQTVNTIETITSSGREDFKNNRRGQRIFYVAIVEKLKVFTDRIYSFTDFEQCA
jgi:hypothetical protein